MRTLPLDVTASGRGVAAVLFDHQLWCMGQDIHSPQGNLLVAYGFARHPSCAARGTSAYTLPLVDVEATAVAWGYGMGVVHPDLALLVRRHPFGVEHDVAIHDEPWAGRPLPRKMPRIAAGDAVLAERLLTALGGALADYERWVTRHVGASWREHCAALLPRHKRRRVERAGVSLGAHWGALHDGVRDVPHPVAATPPSIHPHPATIDRSAARVQWISLGPVGRRRNFGTPMTSGLPERPERPGLR